MVYIVGRQSSADLMALLTVQQKFDLALHHHQAGRLREAEQLYQQILAAYPRHPDALHNMGVLARQVGQNSIAMDYFRRCIAIQPDKSEAHNNLGVALRAAGQLDQSIAACRQAIALHREYPEAHFNLGLALNDQGELDQAIAAYRRAINYRPGYAEAHSSLGAALCQKGAIDESIAACSQAIALAPGYAQAYNNLGIALIEKEKLDQAIAACRQAISLQPHFVEAYFTWGNALKANQNLAGAIDAYRQAVAIRPDHAVGWNSLGIALHAEAQLEEAVSAFQRALALKPDYAEAWQGLAFVYRTLGKLPQAIDAYRQALTLNPTSVEVMSSLGVTLCDAGKPDEAIGIYRRAIALKPDYADAHHNLGIALSATGQLDEAAAACRQALVYKPDLPEALTNLGDVLKNMGSLNEAIVAYRKAVSLKTGFFEGHSSLLYMLSLCPGSDPKDIAEEHRLWNRLYAKSLGKNIQLHCNNRDSDRPLRIGYISPDFRGHVVSCFMLPLLNSHDRARFEIYCYGQVSLPDQVTQTVQDAANVYRSIIGRSDTDVARMIREDQIDILVDLAGHTGGNRLLMFAMKPAPVQFTFLGYPATTGLDTIDYRMTDAYADPPGMTESHYSEKLIRLPRTAWCYQPLHPPPPISESPVSHHGHITFGSFNNFAKVNPPLLRHWASILQSVAGSRLLIKGQGLRAESVQHRVRETMQEMGIGPDRLDLRGWVPAADHLSQYGQIDIALDTFPYNGTTTTCEAILMGVPVVTLAGKSHVARVGVSLLSNMGLPELIGETPEQYVQIAVELANDLPRLKQLRSSLRGRMQQSPLMDGPNYAEDIESAYRKAWRSWCKG